MRLALTCAMTAILAVAAAGAGEPVPPKFTSKPAATKAGERVKIEFAVDRETDVAVFIENGGGKIVRHLVAGVLGKNPPPPLKPGLAQSVEWDGLADYGKPAGTGPFKVRVALGMNVRYDNVLMSDPNTLGNVKGLATGPDGTLYVLNQVGGAVWHGEQILAFGRDGRYQRTVSPFPASLKLDQVKEFGAFEVDGRASALVHNHRLQLFPGEQSPRKTGMAVTPDGKAIVRLAGGNNISAVGTAGDAVWSNPGGPPMLKAAFPPDQDGKFRGGLNGRPLLAVSADGRWAYISGLRSAKADNPAVFRAPLPERAPATPFFGDPLKPGKDQTSLGGAPRGLAADGKGHLLVADPANRRVVVVAEADGKYAGEFAAEGPDCLAVDPASGAVYMTCTGGKTGVELVKLSGWKDPKELARLPLHTDGNPGSLPVIALDAGAKPPLVWFGTDGGTLLRIEDLGARFGEPRTVSNGNAGNSAYLDVSVDRLRKEVYTRCGTGRTWWWRFSEETGHVEKVQIPEGSGGGQGVCMVPAPDGNLYGLKWPYSLIKWDRAGKPLAWEAQENPETFINKEGKPSPVGKMPAHHKYVPVSETEIPHCLGVRWSDGHIFVLQPGRPGDRPPKALHEYLSSGKRVTTDPIIWKTSDAVLGPRFDAAGNIYIAEHVTPKDWAYPPELQKVFGPVKERLWGGPQHENAAMYGSIVKFSPKGGMVHAPMDGPMGGYNPFDGEPKLDPALKATELVTFADGLLRPIKVTGAEWVHPGISHAGVHVCTCENVTFDVDEFGRVFAPDLNLFQVRVIDTNGNALTRFGGYGNADSPSATLRAASEKTSSGCDPESKDKALANPEIAFAWLVGVGATDRYVYTGDSINRRMLRSKIVYAAEESCTVQ